MLETRNFYLIRAYMGFSYFHFGIARIQNQCTAIVSSTNFVLRVETKNAFRWEIQTHFEHSEMKNKKTLFEIDNILRTRRAYIRVSSYTERDISRNKTNKRITAVAPEIAKNLYRNWHSSYGSRSRNEIDAEERIRACSIALEGVSGYESSHGVKKECAWGDTNERTRWVFWNNNK